MAQFKLNLGYRKQTFAETCGSMVIFMSPRCKLCELLMLWNIQVNSPIYEGPGGISLRWKKGREQMSLLSNYILIQHKMQSSSQASLRQLAGPKANDSLYHPPTVRHKAYKLATHDIAEYMSNQRRNNGHAFHDIYKKIENRKKNKA